jgi:hypothetical protein
MEFRGDDQGPRKRRGKLTTSTFAVNNAAVRRSAACAADAHRLADRVEVRREAVLFL